MVVAGGGLCSSSSSSVRSLLVDMLRLRHSGRRDWGMTGGDDDDDDDAVGASM